MDISRIMYIYIYMNFYFRDEGFEVTIEPIISQQQKQHVCHQGNNNGKCFLSQVCLLMFQNTQIKNLKTFLEVILFNFELLVNISVILL
jgi:hypothetical protein